MSARVIEALERAQQVLNVAAMDAAKNWEAAAALRELADALRAGPDFWCVENYDVKGGAMRSPETDCHCGSCRLARLLQPEEEG